MPMNWLGGLVNVGTTMFMVMVLFPAKNSASENALSGLSAM